MQFPSTSGDRLRSYCRHLLAPLVLAAAISPCSTSAETVVEKYPDGTVQFKYDTLPDGSRQGPFNELYPDGKPRVRGTYTKNQKSGAWLTFDEKGTQLSSETFKKDLLDGPTIWNFPNGKPQTRITYKAGEVLGAITVSDAKGRILYKFGYPRSYDAVQKAWKTWTTPARPAPVFSSQPSLTAPYKAGALNDATCQSALKYVKLYRFLSGVSTNLTVDASLSAKAQAASVLIHRLGHLTHTPEKPDDMPADFYQIGSDGCHQSNLSEGCSTVFDTIDGYMADSDGTNSENVGHRQWLLHPSLEKIGIGYADRFSAIHIFDATLHQGPDYNYICYPGEGYYPASMLKSDAAWSVHLAPKWSIDSTAKVVIHQLDEHYAPLEEEIPVTNVGFTKLHINDWHVLIFQPKLPKTLGARYLVEVLGAQVGGRPQNISYLVDLIDPAAPLPTATTEPAMPAGGAASQPSN